MSKILDILTAPWAIQPSKLIEMRAIYATHMRGDKIDLKAVEAALGRPLNNEPQGYRVDNGVAVLPIEGVIAKRMNLFTQISGGTSTQLLSNDLRAALDDPNVHSILLDIDSPGGSVDGTQLLADQIFQARSVKPIIALASGCMCSAAYWIGSAASKVYATDQTTQVGSIGVVATHQDYSAYDRAAGIKYTEITAGKYKRIASEYRELTDEGRQSIQEDVDYYYSIFVDAIAAHRGVSAEQVLADMADGRVFIGRQAVDHGLVDGVSTLEELVARLNQGRAGAAPAPVKQASIPSKQKEQIIMALTREQIEKEAPEIVAAIRTEAATAAATAARAEGAEAERARIKGVHEQSMRGHETLIEQAMFDGKTTGPEAAVAILQKERAARTTGLNDLRADTPPLVPHAPAPAADPAADAGPENEATWIAKWEKDPKLQAEFGNNKDTYLHFKRAVAAGKVKVLAPRSAT